MTLPISGKVSGLSYEIESGACFICDEGDKPVFRSVKRGICESCAALAELTFRRAHGETLPGHPAIELKVQIVRVLVTRPREGNPWPGSEVLMVERKEEPGSFTLPGGRMSFGSEPDHAAAREFFEATGAQVFAPALEPLWTGLTPRSQICRVYLAKAWTGEPKGSWRSRPMRDHTGTAAPVYLGVDDAFEARQRAFEKTAIGSAEGASLSVRIRKAAATYIEKKLLVLTVKTLSKTEVEDLTSEVNAAYVTLNDEEKRIAKEILAPYVQAVREEKQIGAEPAENRPVRKKAEDDGFAREAFGPEEGESAESDDSA